MACPSIEIINFHDIPLVDDALLCFLALRCPLISNLDLSTNLNGAEITDCGIIYLSSGCNLLQIVELQGLVFTDNSITIST